MTKETTERYKFYPKTTIIRKNGSADEVIENHVKLTVPAVFNYETSDKVVGYREKIRRHQNATSTRLRDKWKWTGGTGDAGVQFFHLLSPGGKTFAYEIWSGAIFSPDTYPALPSTSAKAENEARMKFYRRAKEAQTAFRGLTTIGELRETLKMLRRPGRALRKGLDDYLGAVKKRTRRAKRSSYGDIVGGTWLEHAFGWRPLLSDIKSAGEALNRRLNRFMGHYTRVSGTGEERTSSFDATLTTYDDSWLQFVFRRLHRTSVSVRYYGEVRSVCENPVEADMRLFGTNFEEIVPTAWELIPYSFLVDYFTNIGDVLDAWSVRRSDIAWSARVEKLSNQRTFSELRLNKTYTQNAVNNFISWHSSWINLSPYKVVRSRTERAPTTVPLPSIQMEIPGMGTKWINMTALLASRNRTRRQLFS
jgi:hypothetical protein